MSKKEIVASIAEKMGATQKDVKAIVDMFVDEVKASVVALGAGEKVSIPGFGAFTKKEKPARTARNPKTGESVAVPAKTVAKFKLSKDFVELVNG